MGEAYHPLAKYSKEQEDGQSLPQKIGDKTCPDDQQKLLYSLISELYSIPYCCPRLAFDLYRSKHDPLEEAASFGWFGGLPKTFQEFLELSKCTREASLLRRFPEIDMFENNATTISALHSQGRWVTCYFSAGSHENWRPDAACFNDMTDSRKPLDCWTGEWWLSTNSTSVRNIMLSRLDLASTKGCDGFDLNNVDGYDNGNGLDLKQADAVAYINF
ncbi:glycoside hydrolase superfamily [Usnea florida]